MVKITFSTAAIVCALAISSVLSAPAAGISSVAPPSGFAVTSFGINGSGCPAGSASYFIDDKTGLNVVYSSFYAEAGPGVPISENRKNCQLTLGVRLDFLSLSGYYYLDPAVTAAQETLYYLGPVPGDYYNYGSSFPFITYSVCGTNTVLNIGTSIRASNTQNSKGSGYIATDDTKVSLTQLFNLAWQAC
ncbi:hypothetical protein CVT25_007059 [Psilocybe cyanescens]|uniref:DUF4360 domain-containing protein n=1 Tax=Psilocybe cyanescens TaxID=93625 RepID=A0A409WY68_PSICY|nr:hypothetical protein CVT25_007059 [Psilocybe cyanescens]